LFVVLGAIGGTAAFSALGITTNLEHVVLTGEFDCPGCIGSSDIDPTQVQERTTGSCPAGEAIRIINEDGTVVCDAGL